LIPNGNLGLSFFFSFFLRAATAGVNSLTAAKSLICVSWSAISAPTRDA